MAVALAGVENYRPTFEALPTSAARTAAWERFARKGFPSLRAEAWKYTNVAALQNGRFQPQPLTASDLAQPLPPLSQGALGRLLVINGRFDAAASQLSALPAGLRVSLAQPSAEEQPAVPAESVFYDLNQALAGEQLLLSVDEGLTLDAPLELLFVTSGDASLSLPRTRISLAAGARLTLVERHIGVPMTGQGAATGSFACPAMDLFLAPGAHLQHYRLQREAASTGQVSNCHARLEAGARWQQVSLNLGAALARNELRVALAGPQADVQLIGAQLVGDGQTLDTTSFIDHACADTTSEELYKSVLSGRACGVFQGKIEVQQDSQRIVGNQMSRALMLSDQARMDIKPELEIYADDVQCSHGATVGDLDEQALFYLRARGLSLASARRLLVSAFVQEIIDRIDHQQVREAFAAEANHWLQHV